MMPIGFQIFDWSPDDVFSDFLNKKEINGKLTFTQTVQSLLLIMYRFHSRASLETSSIKNHLSIHTVFIIFRLSNLLKNPGKLILL